MIGGIMDRCQFMPTDSEQKWTQPDRVDFQCDYCSSETGPWFADEMVKSKSELVDSNANQLDCRRLLAGLRGLKLNCSRPAELSSMWPSRVRETENNSDEYKEHGYSSWSSSDSASSCSLSRSNSVSADDSNDGLLKTPAGYYDQNGSSVSPTVPPLFDYSPSAFMPRGNSTSPDCFPSGLSLYSIEEDSLEKCSDITDELSISDEDARSFCSSLATMRTAANTPEIHENEDNTSSEQQECIVLSVLQNVLSDETVLSQLQSAPFSDPLSTHEAHEANADSLSSVCQTTASASAPLSVETTSLKCNTSETFEHSRESLPSPDTSTLNPYAPSFSYLPQKPSLVPFAMPQPNSVICYPVKFTRVPLVQGANVAKVQSASKSRTPVVWGSPVSMAYTPFYGGVAGWPHMTAAVQSGYRWATSPAKLGYYQMQPVYFVAQPHSNMERSTASVPPRMKLAKLSKKKSSS